MEQARIVREYVRREFVEPARRQGLSVITVVAGDVHKGVGLQNRVPLVCQALGGKKILAENHMTLERREGPASGLGTTVKFTYRLESTGDFVSSSQQIRPSFVTLRGVAKERFASLGGGEAFIRREREYFHGDERDR